MESGITEKRLADKRFRKTEGAILRVFFEAKEYISVKRLALKIGVARSTIYLHHKTIQEILPDYEKYILKKYSKMVRRLVRERNVVCRMLYMNILLFIMRDKEIFRVLLKNKRKTVFEEMILKIRLTVETEMGLPKNSEKLYRVFSSEIAELIVDWGRRGFVEKEMNVILSDMLSLTETARTRLVSLLDN